MHRQQQNGEKEVAKVAPLISIILTAYLLLLIFSMLFHTNIVHIAHRLNKGGGTELLYFGFQNGSLQNVIIELFQIIRSALEKAYIVFLVSYY